MINNTLLKLFNRSVVSVLVLAVIVLIFSLMVNSNKTEATTAIAAPLSSAKSKPNIVFILVDDLDELTTPYWNVLTQTASLIKDRGTTFTNAFSPTPICCPARATILTGKYAHNTGVYTNAGQYGGMKPFIANGNEQRTVAVYLQSVGYKTFLVGKYLNGIEEDPYHIPPGWSEWNAFIDNRSYYGYGYKMNENGEIVKYGTRPADYQTDVIARKSIDFIKRAEANDAQPFFMYIAPTAPHIPIPPAPRHRNHPYKNATAPHRPNFQEEDISDKSIWLQESGRVRSLAVRAMNDRDYQHRMGSLYAIDEMVAGIVEQLKASGEFENTLIVFASDNGYNMGSHRLVQKMAPYDESIKVPLIISGPGVKARKENRMVLEIDYAPTFLEMAGLDIPSDIDGRSLAILLKGETPPNWRKDFIAQYRGGGLHESERLSSSSIAGQSDSNMQWLDVPSYKALRTSDYTFIEWYWDDEKNGNHEYELYDLKKDPYQLYNLLSTGNGRTKNALLVDNLKQRMKYIEKCTGKSCQN
jgi:N-acetylglucosamine-6-sulfatase